MEGESEVKSSSSSSSQHEEKEEEQDNTINEDSPLPNLFLLFPPLSLSLFLLPFVENSDRRRRILTVSDRSRDSWRLAGF